MASSVTSGSGRYFYDNERVWREAVQSGILPYFIGPGAKLLKLPTRPTRELVEKLCTGKGLLPHIQKNRVGVFDFTVTFSKELSILALGLTNPGEWRKWLSTITKIAEQEVNKLLNKQIAKLGAKGKWKVPSKGLAIVFVHWSSSRGKVHFHIHFAIPNITFAKNGQIASIGNARATLYRQQHHVNIRINKRVDDFLRSQGIATKRIGNQIAPDGIPQKMVEELSLSRKVMNEARRNRGFDGPRAQDFYAREARNEAGKIPEKTPHQIHTECMDVANKHGVTVESLKRHGTSSKAERDRNTDKFVAYTIAREALRECVKRYGTFSANQYRRMLYAKGMGQTTVEALDEIAKVVLKKRRYFGVEREQKTGTQTRYSTKEGKKTTKQAERPYVRQAWDEFKESLSNLGKATLVSTIEKATSVVNRIKESIDPTPRIMRLDGRNIVEFVQKHKPTHYLIAHATALYRGLVSPGTPHERAAVAEDVFKGLRQYDRIQKNTVVIVGNDSNVSAKDLHSLTKIAQRDKCSVVLAERSEKAKARKRTRPNNHEPKR